MIYTIHPQGHPGISNKTFTPDDRSEEISIGDSPKVPGNLQ